MDLVPFSSLLLQSISSPSITSFSILLLFTLQLVFPRLRASDVLDTQFWVALIYSGLGFFAVFFIILDIDLAGSLSGSGLAVTPVVILLAFSAVAFVHRSYLVGGWLLLVPISFELKLTGATNFWLYLIDPLAFLFSVVFLFWHRRKFCKLSLGKRDLQKSVLAIIAVFLGYAVYLSNVDPDAFRYDLVVEDGFVEWMTVLVLMATMIVCFIRVLTLRGQRSLLFLFVTSVLGLFCLFGAGEEVSWGQRMLGLESPEFFQDHNAQGEIGLHNLVIEIDGEIIKLNKLIFGTGLALGMLIYLFIITPLYRRNSAVQGYLDAIAVPMPQNYQVVGYLAIVFIVEVLIDHSKRGEMTEFAGSMMFALNVIYPSNEELFMPDR